jgi:hypothetical protein
MTGQSTLCDPSGHPSPHEFASGRFRRRHYFQCVRYQHFGPWTRITTDLERLGVRDAIIKASTLHLGAWASAVGGIGVGVGSIAAEASRPGERGGVGRLMSTVSKVSRRPVRTLNPQCKNFNVQSSNARWTLLSRLWTIKSIVRNC